jgi:hypothetical protein
MTRNPNETELAVSRTLRDSLEKLQRTTEEVNQAVNDLVSACASTRPSNSLPPMLRAQTSAASLLASLEVLSRFVIASLQPSLRAASEESVVVSVASAPVAAPHSLPVRETPTPMGKEETVPEPPTLASAPVVSEPAVAIPEPIAPIPEAAISDAMMQSQPAESAPELQASDMAEEGDPVATTAFELPEIDPLPSRTEETLADFQASNPVEEGFSSLDAAVVQPFSESGDLSPASGGFFDLSTLRQEERDLHRRADRVAKVAMQDIKMLHPDDVKLGKLNNDLCTRLREDIERAHREYDRRFHSILDHPVDYFYNRMVEILGDGNAEALGEYPYPSPVLRR